MTQVAATMDQSITGVELDNRVADNMEEQETEESPEDILGDLQDMKGLDGLDLTTEDGASTYILRHQNRLYAVNDQGKNILHCHAQQRRFQGRQVYSIISAIFRHGPSMMSNTDDSRRTPLHIAIMHQNFEWIHQMLQLRHSENPPKIDWAAIISEPRPEGGNCLHGVIESCPVNSCPPTYYPVVNALVELAPPAAFKATNNSRCTCLHLAVDTAHIQEGHVSLVKTLLQKNDVSGDDDLSHPDYLSPYQYYKDKFAEWERRPKAAFSSTARRAVHDSGVRGPGLKGRDFRKIESSGGPVIGTQPALAGTRDLGLYSPAYGGTRTTANRIGSGIGGVHNVNFNSLASSSLPESRPGSPAANESRLRTGTQRDGSNTMTQRPAKTLATTRPKATGMSDETRLKCSKEIKQVLKLHYLRKLPPGRATEVLYGFNPESKQIFLDFTRFSQGPGPANVYTTSFSHYYQNLKLARTLKYVDLGRVTFLEGVGDDEKPLVGDTSFFFDWLKKDKGVKRVLRLSVEDKDFPGNSDDTIEKCLEGLQVDVLDWRRVDLGVEARSLQESKVEQLILQWGGSNAVLKGWRDDDGLGSVEMLKKVEIVLVPGITLTPRRISDLQNFEKKLQRVRHQPELCSISCCYREDKNQVGCSLVETPDPAQNTQPPDSNDRHRWVRCMADLASCINEAGVPPLGEMSYDAREQLSRNIKIAVIDDGINIADENIGGKVVGGQSVSISNSEPGKGVPYYESTRGHGTQVAKFILKVFPLADLYSFRLQPSALMGEDGTPRHSFPHESAVKAIDVAIKFNVDIICMAWTVSRSSNPAQNTKMEQDFGAVLDRACHPPQNANPPRRTPILLLCAVEDTGRDIPDTSYPGSISQSRVIRIGAATYMGEPWSHANKDANFYLPGHKVDGGDSESFYVEHEGNSPGTSSSFTRRSHPMSGSSIATSFAAGLAGVILHLARVSAILVEKEPNAHQGFLGKEMYADLRSRARMAAAFESISAITEGNRDRKFVRVWEKFQALCEQLQSTKLPEADKRWFAMADTVRNLVTS
ncbi:hypothetical protein QBC34DRAFT_410078 [Podospora aff. communis PSN243]|uniref:Peptidase S8/S53 domain-containing protein n=1 Tax=Podospora aff. communis PSN243 TaxID=3040156 RepID=A0AAV9GGC3_9PEZI|nr:hypothetical protein QBC34DRAFT_410078 [Podospora aff. communis PSN243]